MQDTKSTRQTVTDTTSMMVEQISATTLQELSEDEMDLVSGGDPLSSQVISL